MSVLDDKQYFTDQSLYNLYPINNGVKKEDVEYINILLNSKVLDFYFNKKIITNPDVFPYIKGVHIKSLPIRINSFFNSTFSLFSNALQYKKKQAIIDVSNALVFELYFPDHMKDNDIDILMFVKEDIEKTMQNRDFEKLNNQEKEKVIEQLCKIWSNPNNEVVKRMGMFREKSPDLLGVILDS